MKRLVLLAAAAAVLAGCDPGDRLHQVDLDTGRFVLTPGGSTTPVYGCLDDYLCDTGDVATYSVNTGWSIPDVPTTRLVPAPTS